MNLSVMNSEPYCYRLSFSIMMMTVNSRIGEIQMALMPNRFDRTPPTPAPTALSRKLSEVCVFVCFID